MNLGNDHRCARLNRLSSALVAIGVIGIFAGCAAQHPDSAGAPPSAGRTQLGPQQQQQHLSTSGTAQTQQVPAPESSAAKVPHGYTVDVVIKNLTYPTSVEFDDEGNMFVAEAGYSYGDSSARPRLLRVSTGGQIAVLRVSEYLNGPVNDLLWHDGRLYISHRGKISTLEGEEVRDLVTGLPSDGDHHNNQMSVGPDGKIYFGQGTASNSGVVGVDNHKMGWLKEHRQFHDIPAKDIVLRGKQFTTENPLTPADDMTNTSAFHAFGEVAQQAGSTVRGQTTASGTILRMNKDGSNLEVFAWGLRNPFGIAWANGKLYASENGFDVRGSRPIANDKEDLYEIKEGAWYGWPDFASGIAVTDPRFKPKEGPEPQFLMAEHPAVEKPLITFPKHSSATKLAVSPGEPFGRGQLFLAFFGHMAPMTGTVEEHGGHRVARIDLALNKAETFFSKQDHHGGGHQGGAASGSHSEQGGAGKQSSQASHSGSGQQGHSEKEESISAGPRRLLDVVFSRDGKALYIADFGSMTIEGMPMPIRNTGVIWRVIPEGQRSENQPPANLVAPGAAEERQFPGAVGAPPR